MPSIQEIASITDAKLDEMVNKSLAVIISMSEQNFITAEKVATFDALIDEWAARNTDEELDNKTLGEFLDGLYEEFDVQEDDRDTVALVLLARERLHYEVGAFGVPVSHLYYEQVSEGDYDLDPDIAINWVFGVLESPVE